MNTARSAYMRAVAFGLATLLALAGQEVTAAVIVVPNSLATAEGNGGDNFTFSIISPGFPPSVRFQQIYDASQFLAVGPGFITQIAFRPNANCGGRPPCPEGKAFAATLPNVQIKLGTTTRTPQEVPGDPLFFSTPPFMSNIFSDNLPDNQGEVVFIGPLTLFSTNTGPAGGPKDFDIIINLGKRIRVCAPLTGAQARLKERV
jgi:hypothetical protein